MGELQSSNFADDGSSYNGNVHRKMVLEFEVEVRRQWREKGLVGDGLVRPNRLRPNRAAHLKKKESRAADQMIGDGLNLADCASKKKVIGCNWISAD